MLINKHLFVGELDSFRLFFRAKNKGTKIFFLHNYRQFISEREFVKSEKSCNFAAIILKQRTCVIINLKIWI
jgi:hypothetical protein